MALTLFEGAEGGADTGLSVDQIAAAVGFSGPTVRLILKRLIKANTVLPGGRSGKTQFYGLSPVGRQCFEGYLLALLTFRAAPAV